MTSRVAVVDYGVGNIRSVFNALIAVGATPVRVSKPSDLDGVSRVILPGVGAFPTAAANLQAAGMHDALCACLKAGMPLLGICLGMQLLTESSNEFGSTPGIGLFTGQTVRIAAGNGSSSPGSSVRDMVPNVGWRAVDFYDNSSFPVSEFNHQWFYFSHSFEVVNASTANVFGDAVYAGRRLTAAMCHGAAVATQFHPEMSGTIGLAFIRAFLEWNGP